MNKKEAIYNYFKDLDVFYYFAINLTMYVSSYLRNKMIKGENEKTAILLSDREIQQFSLDKIFFLPPLILTENLKKRKVDVFKKATSKDLEEVLLDNRYQNVILSGHGNSLEWVASDRSVSVYELDSIPFERKKGDVIKLGCGDAVDYFALRIAKYPEKTVYFKRHVENIELLAYVNKRYKEAKKNRKLY